MVRATWLVLIDQTQHLSRELRHSLNRFSSPSFLRSPSSLPEPAPPSSPSRNHSAVVLGTPYCHDICVGPDETCPTRRPRLLTATLSTNRTGPARPTTSEIGRCPTSPCHCTGSSAASTTAAKWWPASRRTAAHGCGRTGRPTSGSSPVTWWSRPWSPSRPAQHTPCYPSPRNRPGAGVAQVVHSAVPRPGQPYVWDGRADV